ncbi:DUF2065 domain-containing protein [Psychrosphaera aestuarii]|uniref:DUF2065 domain-containing protein n=1 Tax=Psychrosphaera aestuarii TaxID=1266052 RepID=UPI001FD3CB6B|nr:DUF2065 domain-containing protein [Psychrosphaera aestuarii]
MDIDWFVVIAMVLIIEGMMPLLFPKTWRNYIKKLSQEPVGVIRQVGLVLFTIGILLLWFR